jgi:uncharacterized paraquat-inducible protein A
MNTPNTPPKSSTTTYINAAPKYEVIIEDETKCCLCGTDLKFEHKFDYTNLKVHENASCPACQIKLKTRDHTLN